jgi:hypothetical protein
VPTHDGAALATVIAAAESGLSAGNGTGRGGDRKHGDN